MNIADKSLEIATLAHKGQKDLAGIDYIEQPKKVASFLNSDEEKAVAYLHDILEDTLLTEKDLLINYIYFYKSNIKLFP